MGWDLEDTQVWDEESGRQRKEGWLRKEEIFPMIGQG